MADEKYLDALKWDSFFSGFSLTPRTDIPSNRMDLLKGQGTPAKSSGDSYTFGPDLNGAGLPMLHLTIGGDAIETPGDTKKQEGTGPLPEGGPGIGLGSDFLGIGSFFGRIAIIILGMIFVAVGLSMFKQNMVVIQSPLKGGG